MICLVIIIHFYFVWGACVLQLYNLCTLSSQPPSGHQRCCCGRLGPMVTVALQITGGDALALPAVKRNSTKSQQKYPWAWTPPFSGQRRGRREQVHTLERANEHAGEGKCVR